MQLGQSAIRLIVSPLTKDDTELVLDDNVLVVKLRDLDRTGPIRTCQLRVSLDNVQGAGVYGGASGTEVVDDCKTAIVILTSLPQDTVMNVLEQVFAHLTPGGRRG